MNELNNRIYRLNKREIRKGPVVYWMSRDQRARDNWALIYADFIASQQKSPLLVVFCLVDAFSGAARRQYNFMLRGLREVSSSLAEKGIPFFLLKGNPADVLPPFLREHSAGILITDFDPLKIKRKWKADVNKRIEIPFIEADAHNIVPCRIASAKKEYGAYTIRPKIQRLMPVYLFDFPRLKKRPFHDNGIEWDELIENNNYDASVPEVTTVKPGETAAIGTLSSFIKNRLDKYPEEKNDPNKDALSGLSPYLHFGQISAQRIALDIYDSGASANAVKVFLEELIVRRELADNFCLYEINYDSIKGFPDWSRESLSSHVTDSREYIYTCKQFEKGKTHDPLWNAAQMQMVLTGTMHGYIRMYWAKKILQWSKTPEKALKTAIKLNDRYQLDGRDPNGYTGIAWSIGGVHDRAWPRRIVFGKVRLMSYEGCKRKFDVLEYIDKIDKISREK